MQQHHEEQQEKKDKKKKYEELRKLVWAASFFCGLGIYLAVTVGVCIWLGDHFDQWFQTEPVGRMAGIILGFPIAIYSIYKKIRQEW
jgi:F0F1-type ATP synthase assembly protein I